MIAAARTFGGSRSRPASTAKSFSRTSSPGPGGTADASGARRASSSRPRSPRSSTYPPSPSPEPMRSCRAVWKKRRGASTCRVIRLAWARWTVELPPPAHARSRSPVWDEIKSRSMKQGVSPGCASGSHGYPQGNRSNVRPMTGWERMGPMCRRGVLSALVFLMVVTVVGSLRPVDAARGRQEGRLAPPAATGAVMSTADRRNGMGKLWEDHILVFLDAQLHHQRDCRPGATCPRSLERLLRNQDPIRPARHRPTVMVTRRERSCRRCCAITSCSLWSGTPSRPPRPGDTKGVDAWLNNFPVERRRHLATLPSRRQPRPGRSRRSPRRLYRHLDSDDRRSGRRLTEGRTGWLISCAYDQGLRATC